MLQSGNIRDWDQLTSIRLHLTFFPLKAEMAFGLQKERAGFSQGYAWGMHGLCMTYEKINNSRIKGLDFKV